MRLEPSPKHSINPGKGSQELVYRAIAAGHRLVGDIMHETGLEEDTVRTAIARLRDEGRVGRERLKGANNTTYFTRSKACLLADVWK